jgi:hypothetical protein
VILQCATIVDLGNDTTSSSIKQNVQVQAAINSYKKRGLRVGGVGDGPIS